MSKYEQHLTDICDWLNNERYTYKISEGVLVVDARREDVFDLLENVTADAKSTCIEADSREGTMSFRIFGGSQ